MTFIEILKYLCDAKIRFLVVGGIAVNLYGIERPTKDIDLVVCLERRNLEKFIQLVTRIGFIPKVPVKPLDFANPKKRKLWIKEKNMLVFSFIHSKDIRRVIDVFVEHPFPFNIAYKRRIMFAIGKLKIPVANVKDLIKLKEKADREQDRADLRHLREIVSITKEN